MLCKGELQPRRTYITALLRPRLRVSCSGHYFMPAINQSADCTNCSRRHEVPAEGL